LMDQGLVRKEILILCRKDSHPLCSVDSEKRLRTQYGSSVCPVCTRLFSDELVQELCVATDRGKHMIDGSYWMTVRLTTLIAKSGIPLGSITWNATAGQDEIDLIVRINYQKLFFELKDKEFGLGDAYPFVGRVRRYGASAWGKCRSSSFDGKDRR